MKLVPVLSVVLLASLVFAGPPTNPDDEMVMGDMQENRHEITPAILCASCRATVTEITKKMAHLSKWGETDIYDAADNICEQDDLFRSYDHIPPTMVAGCTKFYDTTDDLEGKLWKASKEGHREDIVEHICTTVTSICKDFPPKLGQSRGKGDEVPLVDPAQVPADDASKDDEDLFKEEL